MVGTSPDADYLTENKRHIAHDHDTLHGREFSFQNSDFLHSCPMLFVYLVHHATAKTHPIFPFPSREMSIGKCPLDCKRKKAAPGELPCRKPTSDLTNDATPLRMEKVKTLRTVPARPDRPRIEFLFPSFLPPSNYKALNECIRTKRVWRIKRFLCLPLTTREFGCKCAVLVNEWIETPK